MKSYKELFDRYNHEIFTNGIQGSNIKRQSEKGEGTIYL